MPDDIIFLSCFMAVPTFVLLMARAAGIDIARVSITSGFLLSNLAFGYLGIGVLYFELDPYRVNIGITNTDLILKIFYYASGCLIISTLSFFLCSRISILRLKYGQSIPAPLGRLSTLAVVAFFGACSAVLVYYLSQIRTLPLFTAIASGTDAAKIQRSIATTTFMNYQYYRIVFDGFFPFVCFIVFCHALVKKSWVAWLFFSLVFLVTAFVAIMQTMKAKLVWLIIGLFFSFCLARCRGFNFRHLLLAISGAIVVLIPMYLYFMGLKDRSLEVTLASILSRGIVGQIAPAYFYFEMFPTTQDFLLGRSLPNPAGIFPWENYKITQEVMNYIHPQLRNMNIIGSAPTIYWAEVYANFGELAPFFAAALIGVALYIFDTLLSRLANSPITVGLTTWTTIFLMQLATSGISMFLFNLQAIFIGCISVGLLLLEGRGRLYLTTN